MDKLTPTVLALGILAALAPAADCFGAGGALLLPSAGRPGGLRRGSAAPAPALPLGRRGVGAAPLVPAQRGVGGGATRLALSPEVIFQVNNWVPLPFWAMMIFTPKASWTRRVMSSWLPFLPLIVIYAYLAFSSLTAPGALELFNGPITLAALSKAAQAEGTMAAIWAHLIVGDLFVGRWILFDSLRNRVFAAHSIVLALFFGPLGLLSHIVTRAVVADKAVDALTDGLVDPMSDERLMQLADDD